MVALLDNTPDFGVDLYGRDLGVVGFLGKISSEKNLFIFIA